MGDLEANKATVQRLYDEGFNAGVESVFAELYHPSFRHHSKVLHDLPPGGEGERQSMLRFRQAIPDAHFTVLQTIAEGDMVAARLHMTGTPTGDFGDVAAGGRFDRHALALFRLVDGRLADEWFFVDGGTAPAD